MSDNTKTPAGEWTAPYGEDPSLSAIAIATLAESIGKLEYADKGQPVPEEAELLRIATERYESSKKNGSDDYLGTAKQNQ